MTKKELIKESALRLFNEGDSLSVTTNHIAKEAGISPGNLYYHYRNKEAIIRDIFLDMRDAFDANTRFDIVLESENPLIPMFMMFDQHGEILWQYRFFKRDVPILIRMDEELKTLWLEVQTRYISEIHHLIKSLSEKGIFIQRSEKVEAMNAKLSWFISAYWQVFATTMGEITPESANEGKEMLMHLVIIPNLTDQGEKLLGEALAALHHP